MKSTRREEHNVKKCRIYQLNFESYSSKLFYFIFFIVVYGLAYSLNIKLVRTGYMLLKPVC